MTCRQAQPPSPRLSTRLLPPGTKPGPNDWKKLGYGGPWRIGAQILALEGIAVRVLIGVFVEVQHSRLHPPRGPLSLDVESARGRFCCKSPFALVIKISFGCTRRFRVKMWGASSPADKLAGDLGNVIEATSISGRRSDFFTAKKLAPSNLRLLQQYLPGADSCSAAKVTRFGLPRHHAATRQLHFRVVAHQKCDDA